MFSNKRVTALLCGLIMLFTSFTVFADNVDTQSQSNEAMIFTDVPTGYWAYDAIKLMAESKIIEGSKGYFRPEEIVTRAQFAKMLTVALNLPIKEPSRATFKDISKRDWTFKYAETAKYYLTGFRTSAGDYFKPADPVLKEDMAVALVKALGYGGEAADESILDNLQDKGSIAKNLRKYVAIAIQHGIIDSEPVENSDLRMLNPKASLNRASVAVLLCNILQEEKVTYDEDTPEKNDSNGDELNDYVDKTTYAVPKVSVSIDKGKVLLKWQKINDDRLQGYKVVISQKNSAPKYPENGYLYWITDKNRTYSYIDNSTPYNSGDFGKYLKPGEKYYLSVTAVYDSIKVPGNAVSITYSEKTDYAEKDNSGRKVTSITYKAESGKLVLYWNKVSASEFAYYKVVISKNNKAPKYPDDGYLYYFTDVNTTSATIDNSTAYNGGDVGDYLEPGEEYYFSITAVYQDEKVPGSVIRITFPE